MRENHPGFPSSQCPAGSENGAAQVRVGSRRVAQPGEQQVDPRGQMHRRLELQDVFLPGGPEAPASNIHYQFRDRAAVQVTALDPGDRNPLREVVEKLLRVVPVRNRRVAENAGSVERQRRGLADRAAQSV